MEKLPRKGMSLVCAVFLCLADTGVHAKSGLIEGNETVDSSVPQLFQDTDKKTVGQNYFFCLCLTFEAAGKGPFKSPTHLSRRRKVFVSQPCCSDVD